jgi:hypothetical protein
MRLPRTQIIFRPRMKSAAASQLHQAWKRAVARVL